MAAFAVIALAVVTANDTRAEGSRGSDRLGQPVSLSVAASLPVGQPGDQVAAQQGGVQPSQRIAHASAPNWISRRPVAQDFAGRSSGERSVRGFLGLSSVAFPLLVNDLSESVPYQPVKIMSGRSVGAP